MGCSAGESTWLIPRGRAVAEKSYSDLRRGGIAHTRWLVRFWMQSRSTGMARVNCAWTVPGRFS